MTTITPYIEPLLAGEDLSQEQASALLDTVFEGGVPEAQIAAFLTAMRIKGATASELAGLAGSLRSHAVKVDPGVENLVDTCGTGGGTVKTCNVSTASALVAAGTGVCVAKHGNRGITSKCGSADVLEALGVKVDLTARGVEACIAEAGIGFMFAPMFHPAMKHVQPVRKVLGFRTVFNQLGPLANPAAVKSQVLGVADEGLAETMAQALNLLGTEYAMVVHSDGLDEISTLTTTRIIELKNGTLCEKVLPPADLGIAPPRLDELTVKDPQDSANTLRAVLSGEETGPRADIVLLNAAAAIIAGKEAEDFDSGLALAKESVDSGRALKALDKLIEVSNRI